MSDRIVFIKKCLYNNKHENLFLLYCYLHDYIYINYYDEEFENEKNRYSSDIIINININIYIKNIFKSFDVDNFNNNIDQLIFDKINEEKKIDAPFTLTMENSSHFINGYIYVKSVSTLEILKGYIRDCGLENNLLDIKYFSKCNEIPNIIKIKNEKDIQTEIYKNVIKNLDKHHIYFYLEWDERNPYLLYHHFLYEWKRYLKYLIHDYNICQYNQNWWSTSDYIQTINGDDDMVWINNGSNMKCHLIEFTKYDLPHHYELLNIIDHNRTDKHTTHSYLEIYQKLFHPKQFEADAILEIGIGPWDCKNGGSIKLWHDYFKYANIYALDIINMNNVWYEIKNLDRIHILTPFDAYIKENVDKLSDKRFDIIIDDGPHTLESMIYCIDYYLPLLKQDGILIIEDIPDYFWTEILFFRTPSKYHKYINIYDLRSQKNRHDDILFVINCQE